MKFERRFTTAGKDPYASLEFRFASSEIKNPDGTVVFRAENIEVPVQLDRKSTRLNSSHSQQSRMPSSA